MSLGTTKRHSELLDDLVDLYLAEGFQRFTLADLAERMHCSKTTLYALGHSKEAVMRNVLVHFFRTAGEAVERRTAAETEAAARIVAYLGAVADALRPASAAFIADVASHPTARAVYQRSTEIAAERVSELIAEGVESNAFRPVHPGLVADMVATEMAKIQSGELTAQTGLSDAQAYDELSDVILLGISL